MNNDSKTPFMSDYTISLGVARLLDGRAMDYITRDELEELRRAALELAAYKRAFKAHGVAIDEAAFTELRMGTWVYVTPVAVMDQPELPSPYQTLCLAIKGMLDDLIAGRPTRIAKR